MDDFSIEEQVKKLLEKRDILQNHIQESSEEVKQINKKLRSIEAAENARVKKLQSILGEGQKGVAE